MTEQVDTEDRWLSDDRRRDGLVIKPGSEGFVILPRSDGLPVDTCPCCAKPLRTLRAARLCADAVYPMMS